MGSSIILTAIIEEMASVTNLQLLLQDIERVLFHRFVIKKIYEASENILIKDYPHLETAPNLLQVAKQHNICLVCQSAEYDVQENFFVIVAGLLCDLNYQQNDHIVTFGAFDRQSSSILISNKTIR